MTCASNNIKFWKIFQGCFCGISCEFSKFTAPAYAAMEPRQYRTEGGMSVSEGRNGGDERKLSVGLE